MSNLYKKILEKPKEVRRRIAFGVTIFFGIIIFSFWLFITSQTIKKTLNETFNSDNVETNDTNKAPSIKEEIGKMMNLIEEVNNSQENNNQENFFDSNLDETVNLETDKRKIDTTPDYQVDSEEKDWNNFEKEINNDTANKELEELLGNTEELEATQPEISNLEENSNTIQ